MTTESPSTNQVPVVDFSGLDPAKPGTEGWNVARSKVMQALESFGCFEAVWDDGITPEVREAVFGGAMKELFGLPREVKQLNASDGSFHGYMGIRDMDYESLAIDDAARPEGVKRFTDLMWPQGNPTFCATFGSFAKLLSKLDQMVKRMVLESLGVENHFDSLIESSIYTLRLSEYGAPKSQESKISLPTHTDQTMTAMVCQHQIQGLEVLSKDGKWIVPSQNSITFLIGDTFLAWTNGRLEPTLHRVTISGKDTRYSAIIGARPKDDYIVQAPEELVDEEHPVQYKPFNNYDYNQFRFSQAGKEAECTLKAFRGV